MILCENSMDKLQKLIDKYEPKDKRSMQWSQKRSNQLTVKRIKGNK